MFGDPDWSPAIFSQQRRTEGSVWGRRCSYLLSDYGAEDTARGQ